MKKKVLSVLLTLAMVLTLLPVTALADVSSSGSNGTATLIDKIEIGKDSQSEVKPWADGTVIQESNKVWTASYGTAVEYADIASTNIKVTAKKDNVAIKYLVQTSGDPTDTSGIKQEFASSVQISTPQSKNLSELGLSNTNNIIYLMATDSDTNEIFKITFSDIKAEPVVEHPTEITGEKIIITDTTGKVSCNPGQDGTVKAAVTTTEADPQITTKISGWDKSQLKENEVQTQCSTGAFTNVGDITLKTTDNNKYLIVIEVDSGSKVVGVGAKKIEGIKSDVATIQTINVTGADTESVSPQTGADNLNNATPMNAEFAYVEGGKDKITITVTATDTNAKVSYKANPNNEGEITEGGTGNSVTISDVAKLEYGTPITYGIKVVAENGTTKYYKLTLTMKAKEVVPEKPVVTVTSGNIKAGTKDPKVTLSSTVPFTNNENTHYALSDSNTCGLSVGSVEINNKTATVNLTGTAKGSNFTITVAKDAFGDAASAGADAVTVTIDKVKPNISVTPNTIDVGTEAASIELKVTSNLPFKAEAGDQITVGVGDTGLEKGEVTVSENTATIKFTGEEPAKAGTITIKAPVAAYDEMASEESNEVTVSVSTPSTSSGGSSTPSTTVDKPTTDADSGETKVDVNTNSTTSGTTAKATVTGTNMDKAVNSAVDEAKKQGTAPVVEVEVKTSAKADTLNVTLPAASLEKLAEAEDASLVITSDIAEVALDNTALTALADQATGNTVTLEVAPVADSALNEAQAEAVGEADVVDLSLVSNGVVIHDYNNGKITVTLPYKLAAGKDPASVQVYFLDDDGSLTPCATSYDSKTAKVTFTTVHLSKYVIGDEALAEEPGEEECPSGQFTDLDPDKWYHEGVDYAIANGLMNGTGADTFSPDAATNRAMVVTILYRLEGEPAVSKDIPFADVPAGQWYSNAITWAAANGIVTGYSETEFGPDDTITREQMAAILYRYAGYKGYDVSGAADLTGYTDAASVSSWAAEAVRWAVAEGLIEGTGAGTLSPAGDSTRAQAATILMRFCEGAAK